MSKINRSTDDCCTTSPSRRVVSVRARGSGISSAVTIHGPNEPVRSKFFPGVNCVVWRCQSRTLPSLKQLYPATWPSASPAAMWRPLRPITTASSPS